MSSGASLELQGRVAVVTLVNAPVNGLSHAVRNGIMRCLDQAEQHEVAAAEGSVEHDEGDGHHDAHDEASEEGFGHAVGTLVGVMAGLVLVFGHVMNLRASRQCEEACCQ